MINIINLLKTENLVAFDDVSEFFKQEPYYLSIKQNETLYMLNFTDKSDLANEIVREATGIILEKETNKIIHYSFGKTYDGILGISDKIDLLDISCIPDTDTLVSSLYFEGTLAKLYYYNGDWVVGTSTHFDSSTNKWSSKKPIKDLFIESVEESFDIPYQQFLISLSKDHCYTYIFQHPEHLLTILVDKTMCFELNRINLKTGVEENLDSVNFEIPLESMADCETRNINDNYIIYHKDKDGKILNRIKDLSHHYEISKVTLGNLPNPGLKYLEDFTDTNTKVFLRNHYSTFGKTFNAIEHLHIVACKEIFKIHNNNINSYPKRYKKILNKLPKGKVIFEQVTNTISKMPAREIAYIIKYIY
jgi:hypothetical protein